MNVNKTQVNLWTNQQGDKTNRILYSEVTSVKLFDTEEPNEIAFFLGADGCQLYEVYMQSNSEQ